MNRQLLGIDLGTSSVKALLVSGEGRILGQGNAEYPIHYPRPDRAEQSPEEWWLATVTAVRKALKNRQGEPVSVAAIGISGQMHGTVLLDRNQNLLGPAIIWPDRRSHHQVREITELVGAKRLIALTGSPVATGFQAATLRWIQQERPDLWRKIGTILLPKDYLRWRLTRDLRTDPSDGSGSLLLDVSERDWSGELLQTLGITQELLPPVVASNSVTGHLSKQASSELGLPAGTPVVTGAADTACGSLGAGIVDERTLLLTVSTGGQIILPVTETRLDLKGRIHTFCSALAPESGAAGWYQMAAILSAGMSLRWLRDRVFGLPAEGAYEWMAAEAETVPAGANGLLFLPYLAGERTPHMDPLARGMFLGLSTSHGRAEMTRAVMEGVALACYDAFCVVAELGARPERIVMGGGGARSPLWQQIVTDIFDLPLQPLLSGDQASLGAVLLAGSGIGLFDAAETAPAWATYGRPVMPDSERHAFYLELLQVFRSAYMLHRDDFRRLSELSNRA